MYVIQQLLISYDSTLALLVMHCIHGEVECKTKVPVELLLLFHGGEFVQHSISLPWQNIVDGSTVFSLVKRDGRTGNEKAANEDSEGNNIKPLLFVFEFALLIQKLRSENLGTEALP